MVPSKYSNWFGVSILIALTLILYWEFFFLGRIPLAADTLIGAYFPWLDYKWGYAVGVPVKNALISDVFSQFFIWKYLAIDIFKTGQIPFWNNYMFSGTPLMATYHSAVFNPFNVLLLLPKFYGWGFYISLQTLTAMLGMFLFLGLYVKNLWAKVLGSVVFSISALMTTWVEFGTGVWAASMLPWIFLFVEKYLTSKKIRFLFFMSLAFVLLYLSGHAQLTLYSTILVFIYLLVKFIKQKNFKQILLPGIFVFLSIISCSFQFLPTTEFTKTSIRSNEAYSAIINYGLNPPYEIVKFFSADFFGSPMTNNYWDTQSYHEQAVFIGALPFILIISLFIFFIKRRKFNFWMGVFLTSIILGFENPLTKLLYSLPLPFLTYSSAARIFFIMSFSAGILSAIALEKLSEKDFAINFRKVNVWFLAAIVGITIAFVLSILYLQNFPELSVKEIANYKVTLKNMLLPFGIGILSLFSILILKYKPKLQNYILIFLLALTFFDLSRYFYKHTPFISQDITFPQTPITEFIQKQPGLFRIGRLDKEVMPPNSWLYYRFESPEGYDPLFSEEYARLFNLLNNYKYDNTVIRFREIDNFNPKYLDALNVKYLLSVKRDANNSVKGNLYNPKIEENGYKIIFEDQNTVISENPNAKNRAYFVSKLQSLQNKDSLVSIISSKDFDPKNEALILDQLNIPKVTGQGNIEITSYTPNKVEFKTQTKSDEFLIFADNYDKGWKLYRNGNPEKIYQANISLRGVSVPSGENTFVMEYFPDSFKYGLWLSLASILVFLSIFLYTLKNKSI